MLIAVAWLVLSYVLPSLGPKILRDACVFLIQDNDRDALAGVAAYSSNVFHKCSGFLLAHAVDRYMYMSPNFMHVNPPRLHIDSPVGKDHGAPSKCEPLRTQHSGTDQLRLRCTFMYTVYTDGHIFLNRSYQTQHSGFQPPIISRNQDET